MDTFHDLMQFLGPIAAGFVLYRWLGSKLALHQDQLKNFRSPDLNLTKTDRRDGDGKKVVLATDPRIGKLGLGSIWCDFPGATCTCTRCKINRCRLCQYPGGQTKCTLEEYDEHQRHA